jgi:hypothetical protein
LFLGGDTILYMRQIMGITIDAIYESGILRPLQQGAATGFKRAHHKAGRQA